MMSIAQPCLYAEGSGMNVEYHEEEGGSHCGAANCSKFTAHSVGRNAGGFFFLATCAHVGVAAILQVINYLFLFIRSTECLE